MPFHSIDDPVKLRRVIEATLLLESAIDLPVLLRHVVEEARSITGARYGALGVLNEHGTALAGLYTVGLEPEEEARIGARPTGKGILGLLISELESLRLADLSTNPESAGFPPGHPPMDSFLGVPIKIRDEVYGNLYLTDKIGWSEFTTDDQVLVEVLALSAGIAIENTRLNERVRQEAIYEDRDRVARDLHDTVIQRLFAMGLSLQSMTSAAENAGIAEGLDTVISDIDDTIRQVRASIYELGLADTHRGLRAALLSLIHSLDGVLGFDVHVSFEGTVDTSVPDDVAEHLLATVREAVTNIGRHAEATAASVLVSVRDGWCRLVVTDNGRGIVAAPSSGGGQGLVNLERRAERLGGHLSVDSPAVGGTVLTWTVPVSDGTSEEVPPPTD